MRFSKDFPNQLKLQIPLSEVIGKKLILKKRGKDYLGLCPFHNEKTPSFVVNDQKGFYHCFGCSAHGDVVSFVMDNEGLEFKEAVIKLANDYGIKIPIIESDDQEEENKGSRYYEIIEQACQYFENNLYNHSGSSALEYLLKRNLNNKIIKKFRLGFSFSDYENLTNYLIKKNFTQSELIESGLVFRNDNNSLYDRFRNRVIFPITNKSGKVIAFGGRIIGEGQPKYLNSPETEFFKKGQNLYNYSNARKAIYDRKFAVIVEGYMDVISLSNNQIENVVAPLGTSLTTEQLQDLFKITSEVIIFLDGDLAGIKAMRRAIDIALPILNSKNIIRFAFLPSGLDPDDFVKINGAKAVEDLLANAKNLSEVLLEYEARDLGITKLDRLTSPEKKAILETKLIEKINLISDANSKKYFLQYYRNIIYDFIKKDNKSALQFNSKINYFTNSSDRIFDRNFIYAANIVGILIKYPKLINFKNEYYDLRDLSFPDERITNIKESLIEFFDKDFGSKKPSLVEFLNDSCQDYFHLKNQIPSIEKITDNSEEAKLKLEIFSLKFYYEQISEQYKQFADLTDHIETDSISIKEGRQKSLFDHKTTIEKKIIQLENKLFEN